MTKIEINSDKIVRLLNINLTEIFVNDIVITVGAIAGYIRQVFQRLAGIDVI